MTLRAALAALFVAALAVGVSAQIPGYPNGCARCGVRSFIDTPGDSTDAAFLPVVSGEWIIGGWGFECQSGRLADRVEVSYSNDRGFYAPVPTYLTRLETGIARPDVQAAFNAGCLDTPHDAGFHLRLYPGAIPSGVRVLVITVWRGPYMAQSRRTIVVR